MIAIVKEFVPAIVKTRLLNTIVLHKHIVIVTKKIGVIVMEKHLAHVIVQVNVIVMDIAITADAMIMKVQHLVHVIVQMIADVTITLPVVRGMIV